MQMGSCLPHMLERGSCFLLDLDEGPLHSLWKEA